MGIFTSREGVIISMEIKKLAYSRTTATKAGAAD
jgi:hypothetical protein